MLESAGGAAGADVVAAVATGGGDATGGADTGTTGVDAAVGGALGAATAATAGSDRPGGLQPGGGTNALLGSAGRTIGADVSATVVATGGGAA